MALTRTSRAVPNRPGRRPAWHALAVPLALLIALAIVAAAARAGMFGDRQRAAPVAPVAARSAAAQATTLEAWVRDHPDDVNALGQLGGVYVQRARETGDPAYYARAEAAFRRALALAPDDPTAIAGLGSLALSRHQFAEALDWGTRALALGYELPVIYGIVGDAQIELGRYPEAVASFQRMVDLRPDMTSYARVSYARELLGDYAGAVAAMERAAAAGAPGQEGTAWTRSQLGTLRFNGGDLAGAQAEYEAALRDVPGYPHAQAGLGRVAAARGDWAAAIDWYRRATATVPVTEYVAALGDVYAAAGQPQQAEEQYALVRVQSRLLAAAGVATDLEFALFAADHPEPGADPATTVAQARAALVARPSIYGHDALAWALYRAGQYDEAWRESQAALRLGTPDAALHFHAGMIARARGDDAAMREHLTTALRLNPTFSVLHAPEARAALAGR